MPPQRDGSTRLPERGRSMSKTVTFSPHPGARHRTGQRSPSAPDAWPSSLALSGVAHADADSSVETADLLYSSYSDDDVGAMRSRVEYGLADAVPRAVPADVSVVVAEERALYASIRASLVNTMHSLEAAAGERWGE